MTQSDPIAPRPSAGQGVAALLQQCAEDYKGAKSSRTSVREPLWGDAADAVRDQLSAPTGLDTAIRVGQRMLDAYSVVDSADLFAYAQAHGGLTEALRILLRALGAPVTAEVTE
ncbi:hypothetical protein [Streptomyces griseorubiginosus]|uniref:hypothetical protein n=1 Tax=Streptomyces griseorubiginosus TaxID=67304 RepID=UPI0036EB5D1E